MNPIEIIRKKRDREELTGEEIRTFVMGYVRDEVKDYQAAAWCMAVYLNGMTHRETVDLTMALAESGERLDLSAALGYVLDKHSSGGVGDKTTLVVLPLVASFGVPVAKMSGRGLSFTGGTLDKLESISGFNCSLSREQFVKQAQEVGIVLGGQTADLAPADGKFYALRDVTATVSSMPLIASSIMSKKIAGGAQGLVLDVKCGVGAFMHSVEQARELAQLMVDIGVSVGMDVTALISDMNQPLGRAVGNALEVAEAIETLRGGGPADFREHCLVVAGHMLRLAGRSTAKDLSDIRPALEEKLVGGEALAVFRRLIVAQGGDVDQVDHPERLPAAPVINVVAAPRTGYVAGLHAEEVGLTALELGAGRHKKGDPVDHAVGIVLHAKVGDHVEQGAPLFTIHARSEAASQEAAGRLLRACTWSDVPVAELPLFYDVIVSGQG
ncbi:MAG: pyrimidine-nucleoside phosphorylase [Anaerolineae bacterium]